MTGTDPAVDAANRVHEANLGRLIGHDTVVAAAREAFAEVRDLHRRSPIRPWAEDCEDPDHDDYIEASCGEYVCPDCPPVGWTCAECAEVASSADDLPEWPCDTARLIYTSEELNQ